MGKTMTKFELTILHSKLDFLSSTDYFMMLGFQKPVLSAVYRTVIPLCRVQVIRDTIDCRWMCNKIFEFLGRGAFFF